MEAVASVAALLELSRVAKNIAQRATSLSRFIHNAPEELASLSRRLREIEGHIILYRQVTQALNSEDGFEEIGALYQMCFDEIDTMLSSIQSLHGLDDSNIRANRRIK